MLRGSAGELTVLDPFKPETESRIKLVTFEATHTRSEGFEHWAATDVRLAAPGCALFNDVYPAGEPFEPFDITLAGPR
jgi:hypothetical protein